MTDELKRYIDFLFEGTEGYVYAPVKRPDKFEQKFFHYPTEAQALQDWINTSNADEGAHVYISPGIYARPEASKSSFQETQVCWVEFDGQDTINFSDLPHPSAIVTTSTSTHLHAYWRLARPTTKEIVEDINKRLTYYLHADTSGWDSTQLLRPPATFNRKHDLPVVMGYFAPTVHEYIAFDVAPVISSSPVGVVEPANLLKASEVFSKHTLSNHIIKLVKLETSPVGSRSSFMTLLAHELAEEGLNHVEIVSLLYHADERVGKFRDRTDRLLRLTQLAELALHNLLIRNALSVYTFEDIISKTKELEWILPNNWLHRTGQLILSSAPGVGKTQLMLQLAYTLSTPKGTFLGTSFINSLKHSIFFMSLEMDIASLGYILRKQRVNWLSPYTSPHVIDEPKSLTQYENEIERLSTTVVIIDSLTEMLDGLSDNPNESARILMRWCKKVRRRYNCAIILIHHNRKATEGNKKPKNLSDLAGSFQFGKDSDTVIQLWQDSKGIELSTVKCRFGPNQSFFLTRSDSLWYERKDAPPIETTEASEVEDVSTEQRGPTPFTEGHSEF